MDSLVRTMDSAVLHYSALAGPTTGALGDALDTPYGPTMDAQNKQGYATRQAQNKHKISKVERTSMAPYGPQCRHRDIAGIALVPRRVHRKLYSECTVIAIG